MSLFITTPNNPPTLEALKLNPIVTAKSHKAHVTPPSVQQAYTNHANHAKAARVVHLELNQPTDVKDNKKGFPGDKEHADSWGTHCHFHLSLY